MESGSASRWNDSAPNPAAVRGGTAATSSTVWMSQVPRRSRFYCPRHPQARGAAAGRASSHSMHNLHEPIPINSCLTLRQVGEVVYYRSSRRKYIVRTIVRMAAFAFPHTHAVEERPVSSGRNNPGGLTHGVYIRCGAPPAPSQQNSTKMTR